MKPNSLSVQIGLVIALFTLAGGILLYTYWRYSQAHSPVDQATLDKTYMEQIRAQHQLSQQLKSALKIRQEYYTLWARDHIGLLHEMYHTSDPTRDTASMMRVLEAIPHTPMRTRLISPGHVEVHRDIDAQIDGIPFSWNPMGMDVVKSLSTQEPDLKERQLCVEMCLKDFRRYRDFRVSQSMVSGGVSVSIWASGRITQDTFTSHRAGRAIKYAFTEQELVPPFNSVQ